VAAVLVVLVAITANLLVMMVVLACYLTLAAHQPGMQAVAADSVEILQDMLHLKVLEVQHLAVAVAVAQAVVAAADQVEIQEPQAEQTPAVVVVEEVQVQAAMEAQVL
jgi:hypothetical protein